jgi:hypothetical protein
MLGVLLPQVVILLLSHGLLGQLGLSLLDDLLEVAPSFLQSFHGEPGVRVGSNVEALDLPVELLQGFKIFVSCRKGSLKLGVSFAE